MIGDISSKFGNELEDEAAVPIRVAIVEDDEEIRANLTFRIGGNPAFSLVQAFSNAEAAVADLPASKPDVVLMDINLPKMDGVECVRTLKPKMPDTQFVMLTVYEDNNRLFKSLTAGASGYLLKRTSPAKLAQAIREAYVGGSPMTPQIARRVVQYFREASEPASHLEKLAPREMKCWTSSPRVFATRRSWTILGSATAHSTVTYETSTRSCTCIRGLKRW